MKCAICKNGKTKKGFTTVVLEKDDTTLVFKKVPADICENCGEEYISSDINSNLLKLAEDALKRGTTLEMMNFAA